MKLQSLMALSLGLTVLACGPGQNAGGDGSGTGNGSGNGGGTTNPAGGGNNGGTNGGNNGGGDTTDPTCASVSSETTGTLRPVDIIFVIDNSASMTEEIDAVERNINQNFASIIGASGLDYRVIMISQHGTDTSSNKKICITAPLSGNSSCNPIPARPTNSANFFHYSTFINSTDSLSKILSTYSTADEFGAPTGGWSTWLRPDAWKIFVEITDDNSTMTSATFDTQLLAKSSQMFGTAAKRNYVFHSIAGVASNTPSTAPYDPSAPMVTTKCSSAINTGSKYQELSRLTGGLRFPVCDHASYDAVFQAVAVGVVAGATAKCEFQIPPPPAGKAVADIAVRYTPGNGSAAQSFGKVATSADCAGNGFYVEAEVVKLCPQSCSLVSSDAGAKMDIVFQCGSAIN